MKKEQLQRIVRMLPVDLTDSQVMHRSKTLARCVGEQRQQEQEKSSVMASYTQAIKGLKAEIERLGEVVSSRQEDQPIDCEVRPDLDKKTIEVWRLDLDKKVDSRAMSVEEVERAKQLKLDVLRPSVDIDELVAETIYAAGADGIAGHDIAGIIGVAHKDVLDTILRLTKMDPDGYVKKPMPNDVLIISVPASVAASRASVEDLTQPAVGTPLIEQFKKWASKPSCPWKKDDNGVLYLDDGAVLIEKDGKLWALSVGEDVGNALGLDVPPCAALERYGRLTDAKLVGNAIAYAYAEAREKEGNLP